MSALRSLDGASSQSPKQPSSTQSILAEAGSITLIAVGVILTLSGTAIVLTAYQILPKVTMISDLGPWGKGIGFGASAIGIIVTIGGVRCLPSNKTTPAVDDTPPSPAEWIFQSNQANCRGPISREDSLAITTQLERNKPMGIQFNRNKIANTLEGGTCSAMALEFIASYFQIKKDCPNGADYPKYMRERLKTLENKFKASSQEMRTRQAAFNTIEVSPANKNQDHAKNKVQALVNYHGFKVNWCSNHFDTTLLKDANTVIRDLPNGVFLTRILKLANNEKLEEHGHSVVYIQEKGLSLYYDPNCGPKTISTSARLSFLPEAFSDPFHRFQVNHARFYRIQNT